MDFETVTPTSALGSDGLEEMSLAPRLFLTRDENRHGKRSETEGAAVIHHCEPIERFRPIRWPALFALGACFVGMLAYGVRFESKSGQETGTTYSFTLPPAQSAAAVRALPPPNLLKPMSPEEATKENAVRPFVNRPDTPASQFFLKADADDRTRALTCLAQAVYYEAVGEGIDGQRAVAQVVLNRVRHPGFPSTICGVVYEGSDRAVGCQFSFTCDGSIERIPIPWLWTRSKQIAEEALRGRVFAPVGHATHYHADYVLPFWADSLDKTVQLGRHIFYRFRGSLGDTRAFSQHYGGIEPAFRRPGATLVIPQTDENQQLTNALISDGTKSDVKDREIASPLPGSPLRADSEQARLVADAGTIVDRTPSRKPSGECEASADHRQLVPMGALDMRSSGAAPTC